MARSNDHQQRWTTQHPPSSHHSIRLSRVDAGTSYPIAKLNAIAGSRTVRAAVNNLCEQQNCTLLAAGRALHGAAFLLLLHWSPPRAMVRRGRSAAKKLSFPVSRLPTRDIIMRVAALDGDMHEVAAWIRTVVSVNVGRVNSMTNLLRSTFAIHFFTRVLHFYTQKMFFLIHILNTLVNASCILQYCQLHFNSSYWLNDQTFIQRRPISGFKRMQQYLTPWTIRLNLSADSHPISWSTLEQTRMKCANRVVNSFVVF